LKVCLILLISTVFFTATITHANAPYAIERLNYPKDYPPCLAIVSYEFFDIINLILTKKDKDLKAKKNIDESLKDFITNNAKCINQHGNDNFKRDIETIKDRSIDEKITYLRMRYERQLDDSIYKKLEQDGVTSYYVLAQKADLDNKTQQTAPKTKKSTEKSNATKEDESNADWLLVLIIGVCSVLLSYFVIANIRLKKALMNKQDKDLPPQNQDNRQESDLSASGDNLNQKPTESAIVDDNSATTLNVNETIESPHIEVQTSQTIDYDSGKIIEKYNQIIKDRSYEKSFIAQWNPTYLCLANLDSRKNNSDIEPEFAESDYRESDFWLLKSNDDEQYFLLPSYRMFEKGMVFSRGGVVAKYYLSQIFEFEKSEDFRVEKVAVIIKTPSLEVKELGKLFVPMN
jgi:hypothetical protein